MRTKKWHLPFEHRIQTFLTMFGSVQFAFCFFIKKKLHTLLIKRTEDGKTHGGQISFPGGKFDAEDFNLNYTALRECEEEIGLNKNKILTLGNMSKLFIPPSNFMVYPLLCFCDCVQNLIPSVAEVAEIIEIPLEELFKNKNTIAVKRNDNPNCSKQNFPKLSTSFFILTSH